MADTTTGFPIDAVITWVDGNDPAHKAKRRMYTHSGREEKYEEMAAETRFASIGEINYCVASILRFAPWIRKIFILTDNQNPHVETFVDRYFPNRTVPIEIVDHKQAFAGYEKFLPVFNSLSIESVLWRIPGLGEHYIYFNDDVMLTAPVRPDDFFKDGKIVSYGRPYPLRKAKRKRFFKHLLPGHKPFTYKHAMINTMELLHEKGSFPLLYHVAFGQCKSLFAEFYAGHEEALSRNINCRFRESHQYNPQLLNYLLARREGRLTELSAAGRHLYLRPAPIKGKDYIQKKIRLFEQSPEALFVCINSIDLASAEDRKSVFEWLHKRLGLA